MLGKGDAVPAVLVWTTLGEDAQMLREVLGEGFSLLCIYVYDWSPT